MYHNTTEVNSRHGRTLATIRFNHAMMRGKMISVKFPTMMRVTKMVPKFTCLHNSQRPPRRQRYSCSHRDKRKR
jgi:hypothetical protein